MEFLGRPFQTRLVFFMMLLVLLPSCRAHASQSPQTTKLRDNILEAYGGSERLSQIQSVAAEGSITAIVRGDSGLYRRAWRKDGKLLVDIQYMRSRETRILNGQRTLRGVDGKIEDVSGPGAAAMIYQYNEISMPFALLDETFEIEIRGRDMVDGVDVRVLRCTSRSGNRLDLFVSETTHRIMKARGSFSVNGRPATLSSEYGNFRFVQGILLPFRIVNYSGSIKISEISIENYLINAPLNDSLFDPLAHIPQQ